MYSPKGRPACQPAPRRPEALRLRVFQYEWLHFCLFSPNLRFFHQPQHSQASSSFLPNLHNTNTSRLVYHTRPHRLSTRTLALLRCYETVFFASSLACIFSTYTRRNCTKLPASSSPVKRGQDQLSLYRDERNTTQFVGEDQHAIQPTFQLCLSCSWSKCEPRLEGRQRRCEGSCRRRLVSVMQLACYFKLESSSPAQIFPWCSIEFWAIPFRLILSDLRQRWRFWCGGFQVWTHYTYTTSRHRRC